MIREVPETSVVASILRANASVATTSYEKIDLYVSLAANSAYYIDMGLVTADGPFRHKLTYSGTLHQLIGGRMFQQEMQSGLYAGYSVGGETATTALDETVEVRGLLVTATAGVLILQARADTSPGSVEFSAGSFLIARKVPGL